MLTVRPAGCSISVQKKVLYRSAPRCLTIVAITGDGHFLMCDKQRTEDDEEAQFRIYVDDHTTIPYPFALPPRHNIVHRFPECVCIKLNYNRRGETIRDIYYDVRDNQPKPYNMSARNDRMMERVDASRVDAGEIVCGWGRLGKNCGYIVAFTRGDYRSRVYLFGAERELRLVDDIAQDCEHSSPRVEVLDCNEYIIVVRYGGPILRITAYESDTCRFVTKYEGPGHHAALPYRERVPDTKLLKYPDGAKFAFVDVEPADSGKQRITVSTYEIVGPFASPTFM